MDKEKLENLADDFATSFIINETQFQVDGTKHRHLVKKFKEFGKQIILIYLQQQIEKTKEDNH